MSLAPLDLHATVADALEKLRLAHPRCGLVHVRAGEGSCVADANRLVQLIGNLVSNADAYGEAGTAVIVTSTVASATFSLAVHNLGAPIPAAMQAALFEPGAKVRSVGLGLFIVREIARAHGGTATVESTAEAGTTFRAAFPRAPAASAVL